MGLTNYTGIRSGPAIPENGYSAITARDSHQHDHQAKTSVDFFLAEYKSFKTIYWGSGLNDTGAQ